MGEANFDGRMIGLQGEILVYPQWFFALLVNTQRRLIRIARETNKPIIRILERDKTSGFWRVLPQVRTQLGALLDLPNYNPRVRLRAFNPGYQSGRPRHCGKRGLIDLLESGMDPTRQQMRQCEEEIEHTRMSDVRMQQIVQEIQTGKRSSVNLYGRPGE